MAEHNRPEYAIPCADAASCPHGPEIQDLREGQIQILQAVARLETRMQERDRATQFAMGIIGMLIAVATWGLGMLLGTRK